MLHIFLPWKIDNGCSEPVKLSVATEILGLALGQRAFEFFAR
jgi:hypothetical protein